MMDEVRITHSITDVVNLTEDEAIELARGLLLRLDDEKMGVEAGQRRIAGIRKMVEGLVEMFPAVEDDLPDDFDGDDEEPRPRGAVAAYRVLSEREGKWFTVANVVEFLDQMGWLPNTSSNPSNAVRTALERLVKSTDVVHKSKSTRGDVIYAYNPPPPPMPATAGKGYDEYGEEPF